MLVPLQVPDGVGVSRGDLESAVMRGLAVAGRPLVTSAEATARAARAGRELVCRDAACWARLGSALQAGWLVAGSAGKKEARFRVTFQLLRGSDGAVVATEDNDCEVADCSIAELARRSARELVRQTLGRRRPELVQAPPPPGAAVNPPAAPAVQPPPATADAGVSQGRADQADAGSDGQRPLRRILAFGAVGAGALAVAGGVVALAVAPGRECVERFQPMNVCGKWRDYQPMRTTGIVAIAAGAVVAGVGGYLLLVDHRRGQVAVGVGPGTLELAGRF